jgi:hypothetical protein
MPKAQCTASLERPTWVAGGVASHYELNEMIWYGYER